MDMYTQDGGKWVEVVEGIDRIKGDGENKIKFKKPYCTIRPFQKIGYEILVILFSYTLKHFASLTAQ